MPRTSIRQKILLALAKQYDNAKRMFLFQNVIREDDGFSDDDELGTLSYLGMMRASNRLARAKRNRYLSSRVHRKSTSFIFEMDLEFFSDGRGWLNDEEFLSKYRVTRDQLDMVTDVIHRADVFHPSNAGPTQMPVKHQLMVYLHFVGHEAMTDRTQRQVFLVSRGLLTNARNRVVKALVSVRDTYYKWPSPEERKNASDLFEKKYGFPNGFALMDGTLLELAFCPHADDYSDYHGRKYFYSLTVLVINNDNKEIIFYNAGFPGSAHDNRVWENTPICQQPKKYFSPTEYILADTAFTPSNHCVPSYKCVTGTRLPEDEENFNDALSTPRVTSEHTIGIWKGRFGYLRKIRMRLTNDRRSLEIFLVLIDSTVVLHNLLVQQNDPVDIQTWLDELEADEFSDMDDADRLPEEMPLHNSVPLGAPKGTRREQLKVYMRETYIRAFNYATGSDGEDSSGNETQPSFGF